MPKETVHNGFVKTSKKSSIKKPNETNKKPGMANRDVKTTDQEHQPGIKFQEVDGMHIVLE